MLLVLLAGVMMVVAGATVGAGTVMADGTDDNYGFSKGICADGDIDSDLKTQAGCNEEREVSSVAVNLINVVIGLVGLLAVVVIVVGGIQYASSLGQPNRISQARSIIIYGVIGLVVAMLAWVIAQTIASSISGAM